MFGEVPMLNKEELSVYKCRINLPSWTKVEEKETLVLSYCDDNSIKIQPLSSVKHLFDGHRNGFNSVEEENEFNEMILSCIGVSQVLAQKRIGLGVDVCEKVGIRDKAYVVGFYDYLRIYPSREKFEESFKSKSISLKK